MRAANLNAYSESFFVPAYYTYDDSPESGTSLWAGADEVDSDSTAAAAVGGSGSSYDPGQNSYLRRAFDLSDATTATMSFDYWMDVDSTGDSLLVEVSTDENTWMQLATLSPNLSAPDPNAGIWTRMDVPLKDYVGDEVYVQMRFVSDSTESGEGVYIANWTFSQSSEDTEEADFQYGDFFAGEIAINGGTITKVLDEGEYPETASFTSFGVQLGWYLQFSQISFDANIPADTAVMLQVRASDTSGGLTSASWKGPDGTSSTFYTCPCSWPLDESSAPGDTWFQYKVDLVSWNTTLTPEVYSVQVDADIP